MEKCLHPVGLPTTRANLLHRRKFKILPNHICSLQPRAYREVISVTIYSNIELCCYYFSNTFCSMALWELHALSISPWFQFQLAHLPNLTRIPLIILANSFSYLMVVKGALVLALALTIALALALTNMLDYCNDMTLREISQYLSTLGATGTFYITVIFRKLQIFH